MELIKGKWYEMFYPTLDKKFIIHYQNDNTIYFDNIEDNKFYEKGKFNNEKQFLREIPILEIKHLLPKDYKFENITNYYFY